MADNNILLFDGGFGTYYSSFKGTGQECEYANLYDFETVVSIHKEYIKSGAQAIKTNTFGANSQLNHNFSEIQKIIKRGFAAATESVTGTDCKVFADIGYISSDEDNVSDEYLALAKEFLALGAKNFLFETLEELTPVLPALEYIKNQVPEAFIIISFAVSQDGYTKKGYYYVNLINSALAHPSVSLAGLNCVCGPAHLYRLISHLNIDFSKLSVMPNSGYPARLGGRTVFEDNSTYFAEKLLDIAKLGVRAVGGCCGTTPEHIKKAHDLITSKDFFLLRPEIIQNISKKTVKSENKLKNMLESGKKVIAVEIDPPVDCDTEFLESSARTLRNFGCDFVTIADSPLARTRADSLLSSVYVKSKIGIDVIPHLSCRDKNHIGMKASLIGANFNGIDNVLVVTGDPVHISERSDYKGVFSYNSYSLITLINSLNEEIFKEHPFTICGALNINSPNFTNELKRAQKKIENGAFALFTQPVFSNDSIDNLILAHNTLSCKIFAGILPVVSYKNAMFLNNEVAGISVPTEIVASFEGKSPEENKQNSIRIATELTEKIYGYCDGFYLMTPLKRIDIISELVQNIDKMRENK